MKLVLPLVLLISFGYAAYAQTQIGVVFPQSQKVYAGVPVTVIVLASDIPCKQLKVTTTHGTIASLGNCRFSFKSDSMLTYDPVSGAGNPVIAVYRNRIDNSNLIDRVEVNVTGTSDVRPRTLFGTKSPGRISTSELVSKRGVYAQFDGFDRMPDSVYSFTLTTLKHNGTWIRWSHVGAHFTGEMISALQALEAGDRIVISHVRYRMPDAAIVDLNGIDLEIY